MVYRDLHVFVYASSCVSVSVLVRVSVCARGRSALWSVAQWPWSTFALTFALALLRVPFRRDVLRVWRGTGHLQGSAGRVARKVAKGYLPARY